MFGDPKLSAGQCVRNEGNWSEQELEVESCSSPGARCAAGDHVSDPKYGRNDFTTFCLTPLG